MTDMIETIKEQLIQHISPYLIILFGSAVKGELKKESDMDVAFLSDKEMDEYELYMIAEEIANRIGRDVDIVDLKKASTVFRAQIIGTGKEIFNQNETSSAAFKMKAFKEYANLNEERQCILDKIKERGKIYGCDYKQSPDH